MASEKYTTKQIIEALQQARGIMAVAARYLGCHRHTIENYIARYPTVAKAYQEQRDTIVDIAEGKLVAMLDAGEWPAVKYTLSTLGRNRGYVERQEQEISGKLAVKGYVGFSPDEWDEDEDRSEKSGSN